MLRRIMEPWAARHLTELFKGCAENRQMLVRELTLSTETASGGAVAVKPASPFEAAQYLRFFLNSSNPLFMPGEFGRKDKEKGGWSLRPVKLECAGRYRNPETKMEYAVISLRLRFPDEENASEMCFDDHANREGWDVPHARLKGPPVRDVIKVMERAGGHWSNVSFSNTTHRGHLRLVR